MASEAVSLRRFLQIKPTFHLVDSTTLDNNTDKMAKIKHLYDSLNNPMGFSMKV